MNSDKIISTKKTLYPLIINGSSLVSTSNNNIYKYSFPSSVRFKNARVAVGSISMYYSWFNIRSAYSNNTYQLIHPTFAGTTTLTITMPDGNYSVTEINSYLQSQLIAAGLYLVDSTGDYVYYAEIVSNSTYYALQLNLYSVPTALPVGWTNPGAMTFPVISQTPQFVILDNNFTTIIGFSNATYPAAPSLGVTYSVLSDLVPQLSVVQSLILTCTLLNNKFSVPNSILYSFNTNGATFGDLINANPPEYYFVDITDGFYPEFILTFIDQSFNSVPITDTNLVITLIIETNE